jgi:serine/threonine protein kinase
MAPEQARGETGIDQRADIYSLGAIAYAMLTGRLPFEADNPLILLRKIIEDMAPSADQLNPDIDPGTAQVLSQALAKKPSARYLTSGAFARALTHGDSAVVR